MSDRWDDLVTAESYADHVDRWGIYRSLNQALARQLMQGCSPVPGLRVLDLACGTGATLEALMRYLPRECDVWAVDASQAMVDQAQFLLPDPRVNWCVARAESWVGTPREPFDLMTCGAAFWHFDPTVHQPLLALLGPGGRLAFNVPDAQCAGGAGGRHPIQAALADILVSDRAQFPAVHPRFDRAQFEQTCFALGLECVWAPHRWAGPQQALIDLLHIPAMAELVAPELSGSEADRLIERAAARVDPDQVVSVDWWLARVRAPNPAIEN